jgi:hypothetical protein
MTPKRKPSKIVWPVYPDQVDKDHSTSFWFSDDINDWMCPKRVVWAKKRESMRKLRHELRKGS